MGEADEDDLATASAQLRHGRHRVLETLFDGLAHSLTENFPWHIARRRRGSKERQPDLLDASLQFTAGLRAFFDHARAALAIHRLKVRWQCWWNHGVRPIWNRQLLKE